jgi:glycerophosphoryl diester phosphodiesterase
MRRALVWVLFVVLVAQAAVLAAWWLPLFGRGPIVVVAHRGDLSLWPENTEEAVLAAAEAEAGGIEIDVQPSVDGTWFLFHDDSLRRLTGQDGTFADLTAAQIRELEIRGGLGYSDDRFGDRVFRVPELTSVLAKLASYEGLLVVDVKTRRADDYRALVQILAGRRALLICRSAEGAAAAKAAGPSLPTAALVTLTPRDDIDYRLIDAAIQVRSPLDLWLGDPAIVFQNEATYGESSPEQLRRADDWGAEMIIVNEIPAIEPR